MSSPKLGEDAGGSLGPVVDYVEDLVAGHAQLSGVTRHAGIIRARGSGRVGLGVRTDVASASRSLRRLVFHVQDFCHGQRAHREERRQEAQRGRKLRVRSGQDFMAMIFDN